MNMNTDNWKLELDHLLEIFERESTTSLRKINRCFVASGCPFDEEFRKFFVNVSNRRLNASFDVVLFERQLDDRMKMSFDASAPTNDNGSANSTNMPDLAGDHVQPINVRENESMKVEIDVSDALIEIVDSDDEGVVEVQHLQAADDFAEDQAGLNKLVEFNVNDVNIEHGQDDADLNDTIEDIEFEMEPKVKVENDIEVEEDLPFVAFDPTKEKDHNDWVENDVEITESSNGQTQTSPSPNVQKQSKRAGVELFDCTQCEYSTPRKFDLKKHQQIHDSVKPFECEQCDYATRRKANLIRHQRSHEHQKSMGIERNPNDGLFKCSHCDQKFTKWHSFRKHLAQKHKNNQRLFNCERCMRGFTQKNEKEKHELRCKNRHYECHLCRKYVASDAFKMQEHMRTHSGEKPFKCAVCNKYFGHKNNLIRHLNGVHGRILIEKS